MRNQMLTAFLVAGGVVGCSAGGADFTYPWPKEQLPGGPYILTMVSNNGVESKEILVALGGASVFTSNNVFRFNLLNTGTNCGHLDIDFHFSHDFSNCVYKDGILTTGSFKYQESSIQLIFTPDPDR